MAQPRKRLLITAGPTQEKIDPVRFLSNLSTGEMGFALARAAMRRQYRVTLVSGPTALRPPKGVRYISITSAKELRKVCMKLFPKQDCLIMAAAVSDFTPATSQRHKISSREGYMLPLKRTPDILATLSKRKGHRRVVGFCLETRDLIRRACGKLTEKNLDGIVANFYDPKRQIPFGKRLTQVVLIDRDLKPCVLPRQSKIRTAVKILKWMENIPQR